MHFFGLGKKTPSKTLVTKPVIEPPPKEKEESKEVGDVPSMPDNFLDNVDDNIGFISSLRRKNGINDGKLMASVMKNVFKVTCL